MATTKHKTKEPTEADKALLAKILGEAKPYVEQKRAEQLKKKETWEAANTRQRPGEIVEGQADYVFVDTKRLPAEITWSVVPQQVVWHVCRSIADFTAYITKHGLPKHVAFDHDLTPEKDPVRQTATEALNWLADHCIKVKSLLPELSCHSKLTINQIGFEQKMFTARSKVKKAINAQV